MILESKCSCELESSNGASRLIGSEPKSNDLGAEIKKGRSQIPAELFFGESFVPKLWSMHCFAMRLSVVLVPMRIGRSDGSVCGDRWSHSFFVRAEGSRLC
jgi:hypothetical protein